MFITIDGCDAAGKATQSKRLAEKLKAKLFSFPKYDTPYGQLILHHLKENWHAKKTIIDGCFGISPMDKLDPMVFQALQLANRMEVGAELVAAAKEGHVVCDRYIASGLVYGGCDGLDVKWLEHTQAILPQPSLNILIDIDLETSIQRRPERRDRYERDTAYLQKILAAYRDLWTDRKNNRKMNTTIWEIVDGRASIDEVEKRIDTLVWTLQ